MSHHSNHRTSGTGVPVTCNKDCGGECPLLAHVRNGRVVEITNNPLGGPYLTGCARGRLLPDVLYAPDRLKKPLIRNGPCGSGGFREAGWPEALDLVAERLASIKARYGPGAVLHLGGSGAPRGALHNTHRLAKRFLSLSGGYTETYGNYSMAAADYVTPFVLGTRLAGIDPATLQFSKLIVLWGANISDTRLGTETEARIRDARNRGAGVIVIDPRRSTTVRKLATHWLPVHPGTDTALMMAVLYVLIREGLVNRPFVDRLSLGFDELERYVLGHGAEPAKTPAWAEALCGTPAEQIVDFAREYGATHPAALIPGLSIQRTVGGEEAIRTAIALQVATGNLGVLGGSSGALTWGLLPPPRMGAIGVPPNPCRAAVPVVQWPDAILDPAQFGLAHPIKAAYNVGGNYLVQGSDLHKSRQAFAALEFAICHDLFLTPTAQQCDVILPTTSSLERDDIIIPTGGNYLLFAHQAVPPLPETRNDYDIFCELAGRLGFLPEYSEGRDAAQWLAYLAEQSEVPDLDEFRRTGIYVAEDQLRVGLSDFVADPDRHPLATPSGRVEVSAAAYAETGFAPIPHCRILEATDEYPLRLVTPHPRFRIHSQYDNIPRFGRGETQALWIHPEDARLRGVEHGQPVLIRSPQGSVRIMACVTEEIMPGVVSLTEGVWPRFDADGIDRAGSPNVLTSTEPTLPSRATRTHSVLVEVTPLAAPLLSWQDR